MVDAAESVEEGTVNVVDRSLLTTSEAVAVLELSKCRGRSGIRGDRADSSLDPRVASIVEEAGCGSECAMMMDGACSVVQGG